MEGSTQPRRPRAWAVLFAACLAVSALGWAPPVAAAPGDVEGVEIRLPTGARIAGTITNSDHDPVEGLGVTACPVSGDSCQGFAHTMANGTYSLDGLPADVYAIRVGPDGESDYLEAWYTPGGPVDDEEDATPIDATGGDVAGIDLEIARGFSISGTITGASGGGPLAGVSVSALGSVGGNSTTTDTGGHYLIRGLRDDSYEIRVEIPRTLNFIGGVVVAGGIGDPEEDGSLVVVSGANVVGVNVVAPVGLQISGRLTGAGAANGHVEAFGDGDGSAELDGQGRWTMKGLRPGSYSLFFTPAGDDGFFFNDFPLGYWTGPGVLSTAEDDAAVIDLVASNVTGIDASVPVGRKVSGTISGADGSGLPDTFVLMCDDSAGCVFMLTGAGGAWSFTHVPAGSYQIQAFHPTHVGGYFGIGGFAPDADHATNVPVTSSSVTGIKLILPTGDAITGHILDADGDPVVGAHVRALDDGGISIAGPGSDDTAGDGSFSLAGLDPGSYSVSVGLEDGSEFLPGYFDATSPDGYTDDFDQASLIDILDPSGTSYVPITPLRVVDSRTPLGVSGVFAASVPRTFQVAGVGTIPSEAVAVTGNVTVAKQTAAGYVSITPVATTTPSSSTINVPLGDVRANNFTLPLSGSGKLAAVYKAAAGKTAHVIIDITGYFLPGEEDATYVPVQPVRVLDSRTTLGLPGAFPADVPRTLSVAGDHGIPGDAVAITGNLTVVGQTRPGYLSITPDPVVNPSTSTLNFPVGDVRANGVSVPLNSSGDLSIVYKASSGTAHVILDVTGYYVDDPAGLLFHPVTPGRVMDTRTDVLHSGLVGRFDSGSPRSLQVAGHFGVPPGASAVTGNLTVVGQTAKGFVSVTLAPTATPTTSTINFPAGDVRANGVTVPVSLDDEISLVYRAAADKKTHLLLDVTGYFQ